MKAMFKKILRWLFGDYAAYLVYRNGANLAAPANGFTVRHRRRRPAAIA